jgi:hypothetical protein
MYIYGGTFLPVKAVRRKFLFSEAEKQAVKHEMELHARLQHPHIVKLFQVFVTRKVHYILACPIQQIASRISIEDRKGCAIGRDCGLFLPLAAVVRKFESPLLFFTHVLAHRLFLFDSDFSDGRSLLFCNAARLAWQLTVPHFSKQVRFHSSSSPSSGSSSSSSGSSSSGCATFTSPPPRFFFCSDTLSAPF